MLTLANRLPETNVITTLSYRDGAQDVISNCRSTPYTRAALLYAHVVTVVLNFPIEETPPLRIAIYGSILSKRYFHSSALGRTNQMCFLQSEERKGRERDHPRTKARA